MEDEFDWWALIGPVPAPHPAGIIAVPHNRAAYLDRDYEIGQLTLKPGGRHLTEYLRSEPHQLDGVTWFETWPIIIQGRWPGELARPLSERTGLVGHEANLAMVASWLHRAVCLISFATSEGWQVRTAAVDMTARPPQVPEDWPAPPLAHDPGFQPAPEPRPLPSWVTRAWQNLEEDSALSSALSLWHQGMLLTAINPSFGFLAFCSTVEGIAESNALREQINPEIITCAECGNKPGATARFWATVGLVRNEEQVADLRKRTDPYGRRSATSHGRGLHGIETGYGRMHMLRYVPPTEGQSGAIEFNPGDQTQTFMWEELPELRMIAADLIRLAIGISEA